MTRFDARTLLDTFSKPERQRVFEELRDEFPIHPLEEEWNVSAEVVLEAIARASELTQRMFRGILAEAAFKVEVVDTLRGWKDVTPPGDLPYDFEIRRGRTRVRIQVKLQRRRRGEPMTADRAAGLVDATKYVVETQKTRAGKDKDGNDTRPYRFGEFDLLAVCMEPVTGQWSDFRFTVADWLIRRSDDTSLIAKYQPVSFEPDEDWTDDLKTSLRWLATGVTKVVSGDK